MHFEIKTIESSCLLFDTKTSKFRLNILCRTLQTFFATFSLQQKWQIKKEIVSLLFLFLVSRRSEIFRDVWRTSVTTVDARTSTVVRRRPRAAHPPPTIFVVRVHPIDRRRRWRRHEVAVATLSFLLRNRVTLHHLAVSLAGERTACLAHPVKVFPI